MSIVSTQAIVLDPNTSDCAWSPTIASS